MGEAVKFVSAAFVAPIVKIIIVQESAANKKVTIDSRSVTLVVLITKVSDLDGVRISARFYVVAKCFHFLEILGMNDALQQMIKFGIHIHKNTFRIFFIIFGRRNVNYSIKKDSDHRGDRCYEKGENGLCLFELHGKDLAAFGALATMLATDLFQADLHLAAWAFAIDMRFAVFPFIFLQKKCFAHGARDLQKFLVFCHAAGDISRKHPIKNEDKQKP